MLRRNRRAFNGDIPLDDDAQQEIVEDLQTEALSKQRLFRLVFTVVILIPTPMLVSLDYFRSNPALAFESLVCTICAAFGLYYNLRKISEFNVGLAVAVSLQACLKFYPLKIVDVLWFMPLISAITSYVLLSWFEEIDNEIFGLQSARQKLKAT